jgi:hypothetical protein
MKNLHIVFYGFHLYRSFSDDLSEVDQVAKDMWESLSQLGNNLLPFEGLKQLKSHLVCYQNNKYTPNPEKEIEEQPLTSSQKPIRLGTINPIPDFTIKGTLSPYRLNDAYAVDITLSAQSPENTEISLSQLKYFNPQGSLFAPNILTSIGRTIWIYAEIDDDNCQDIAEECVNELLAETTLKNIRRENYFSDLYAGELFGSSLFEFKANYLEESTKQCHILVSLNNSGKETLSSLKQTNLNLVYLLCSYHKILYVNQQAKELYQEIRKLYRKLDKEIVKSPDEIQGIIAENNQEKFKKLETILLGTHEESLKYTNKLSLLRYQYTTIKTNVINYKTSLDNIDDMNNLPRSWQNFISLAEENWQQQIQIDIEYFAPGQDLFQRVIETISGFLQIKQAEYERASREALLQTEKELRKTEEEQKKRDRQLENTIQSLGIGTAVGSSTGSILASSYQISPNLIKQIWPIKDNKNIDGGIFIFAFFTSITIGTLLGVAAMLFTKWILDILNKKELNKGVKKSINGSSISSLTKI